MVSASSQKKPLIKKGLSQKKPLIKKGLLKQLPWLRFFEIFCWAILGAVGLIILSLSLLPWNNFAEHLVSPNSDLFFVSLLTRIPFLGGLLSGALQTPIKFVGAALFLFFNVNQIILLLATSNHVAMNSDKAQRIVFLSIAGYVAEGAVATLEHPPYQGGMGAFLNDLINLRVDPFYFNYGELLAIAGLLFAFEAFLWAGIVLIFTIRESRKRGRVSHG